MPISWVKKSCVNDQSVTDFVILWLSLWVEINFCNLKKDDIIQSPMVEYLSDFMILSAILDYELSLRYDIWA